MMYGGFLIVLGFSGIFLYGVHYMIVLILLEMVLLGLMLFLALGVFGGFGIQGLMFFLLVMVCMGGYGVSLLVSSMRFVGRDFSLVGFVF